MAFINVEGGGSPVNIAVRIGATLAVLALLYNLVQFVRVRYMFWRWKKQGVPMMPHSLLFGHITVLMKLRSGLPSDAHSNYIPQLVYENWQTLFPGRKTCPPVIYIDSWPIGVPALWIIDPETAWTTTGDMNVKRSRIVMDFFKPLTENLDLVSMDGEVWKTWRTRLNPSFSQRNVNTLVPGMVHDMEIFVDRLRRRAGAGGDWGKVFALQGITTDLTIDIIARATLGMEMNEQTDGPSKLRTALMNQIGRLMARFNILDEIKWYNPWRAWTIARDRAIMFTELYPAVMECLQQKDEGGTKTILAQAMSLCKTMPPSRLFLNTVMAQLKVFMFAGHDTTATTLCWVLHTMAKNPEIARKVRAELDEVLENPADMGKKLTESPHLLNSLTYLTALIKETLRFYAPAGPNRDGAPEHNFLDPETGVMCPTDGVFMVDSVRALVHEEEVWPRAREVIPERWLTTDPNDPIYPRKQAWRAFGNGPRVCIGQELAMTELRLAVAYVAREFDIDCAYDEWDATQ
ncbi:cytochrome p450 4v3 [Colletotrichum plurivorum]|uniref:Cytochrome p450 4v3 n=1 Tax=Colletotrichum plurivorum TaxID=2175906 RepID=A0A8H6N8K6_9PEZI|nr:cytochrome p450 4v3 [Colletotrichum plurivorum]